MLRSEIPNPTPTPPPFLLPLLHAAEWWFIVIAAIAAAVVIISGALAYKFDWARAAGAQSLMKLGIVVMVVFGILAILTAVLSQ